MDLEELEKNGFSIPEVTQEFLDGLSAVKDSALCIDWEAFTVDTDREDICKLALALVALQQTLTPAFMWANHNLLDRLKESDREREVLDNLADIHEKVGYDIDI